VATNSNPVLKAPQKNDEEKKAQEAKKK